MNALAGNPGNIVGAQISAVEFPHEPGDEMHLVALSSGFFGGGNNIWHTIRQQDGTWSPYVNLNHVFGNPGGLIGIPGAAVAIPELELHLAFLTSDLFGTNGTIWHTIRHTDGTWDPIGNVNQVVGHASSFGQVAVAGVDGELHLAGLSGGTIWHTIRHQDGSWNPFGNVNQVVGSPGGGFRFVALAGVNFELHLVGVDSDLGAWHTIRHADGSWDPFGSVPTSGVQLFSVSLAQIEQPGNDELDLYLVGLAPGAILMQTTRDRANNWTPLKNVSEVLGGGPFSGSLYGYGVAEAFGGGP